MLIALFDVLMVLIVGGSWAAAVIIVGWLVRRFIPRLDNLKFDLGLLLLLFLIEPLIQDAEFAVRYSETWIFLPAAAAILYYIHRK